MKKATIKTIAKKANVSTATVSRVINNKGPMREETRNKVINVMNQLNYTPNQIARSLRMDNTQTIALIVSDISNTYFAKLSLTIERYLHNFGYTLIVFSTEDDAEKEKKDLETLLEKNVNGIILNTTGKNDNLITQISQNIPVVLVNRKIKTDNFRGDFVDSDNFESMYDLTDKILSKGHKVFGIINGPLYISSAIERFEGFKAAIANHKDISYFEYQGDYLEESGYVGAANLLKNHEDITTIISMNGPTTVGVLKYCSENNINIPEDISLISGTDIVNQNLFLINPMTSIMDSNIIGKKAAEYILERIENKNMGNREFRNNSKYINGNSTKPV